MTNSTLYIGLMSGTSLDGVNGVILSEIPTGAHHLLGQHYRPFESQLRDDLLALNAEGNDEIARSHLLGNRLAHHYADCVAELLRQSGQPSSSVRAIGCHGQTIRHRPDLGFTVQIGNPALLAELTRISVVADFRSRDIAAGGQGAPLVPAFHLAAFGNNRSHRVIVNVGGISNLSNLPPAGAVSGFDCGPGNVLMDGWIQRHLGQAYDADGAWAASGTVIVPLLGTLLAHPYFLQAPPKSTGRDLFHLPWLENHLIPDYEPVDVQATLLELSARCIADSITTRCTGSRDIYLCGGGAHNLALIARLCALLPEHAISTTDALGIGVDWVEAAAFAWLAEQAIAGRTASLPAVTGASGARILGAIYPA